MDNVSNENMPPTKAAARIVRTYEYIRRELGIEMGNHLYDVLGLVSEAERSYSAMVKIRHEHGDHSTCGQYVVGGAYIAGHDDISNEN